MLGRSSDHGFHRWAEVKDYTLPGHKLFRSSSPNYLGNDTTQHLEDKDVTFLVGQEIKHVISFNQYPYTQAEIHKLDAVNIGYTHLPVQDFTAPSREQLKKVYEIYTQNTSTLIHCGYGHGRTGTGVTAVQLYSTQGKNPPEIDWTTVNHVERDVQIAVLRELKKELSGK
ncbi:hypothetical protein K474DRAFT_1625659 [Panus rudis PR-1116 ss-1]|nr:hypothetical protein K474DRAFT_1625659 [Panus rudis PR-1116 ss-1]